MAPTWAPVETMAPPSIAWTSTAKSIPRKCWRTVSAVDVRRRWVSTSFSRPSSPVSNSTLPPSTSMTVSRSTTRATACSSPCTVARCWAAAAMVSAAAIEKRALTPERWSTALAPRRLRVNRAMISTRGVGDVRHQCRFLPDHGDLVLESHGVVRADLGTEPVFERGDDAAAVGVVLGVGARDDEHVEG